MPSQEMKELADAHYAGLMSISGSYDSDDVRLSAARVMRDLLLRLGYIKVAEAWDKIDRQSA